MHHRLILAFSVLMLSACSGSNASGPDASVVSERDAAFEDASDPPTSDATVPVAASPRPDAATPDAGSSVTSVRRDATYRVLSSTHVYAQGLQHSAWGGGTTTPVDLVLDLYEPEGAPAGRPALVIVHGGGFSGGLRTQAELRSFAEYFTSRGWVSTRSDESFMTRGRTPFRLAAGERGVASALEPCRRRGWA